MFQAQVAHNQAAMAAASHAIEAPPAYGAAYPAQAPGYPVSPHTAGLYPSLDDYMGMALTPAAVEQHMQVATQVTNDEYNFYGCFYEINQ